METRKITVVQTRNQKKSVIMSAATTLGELKADLRSNGINYDGMTFFEGISKIELKNNDSVLPHDVPYRGQTTNELVFMLTNTNKKIKSGAVKMSRTEAYHTIKSMGLQDACVKKFGKNFTMCKTANLIALIEDATLTTPAVQEVEAPKAIIKKDAGDAVPENDGCVDIVARNAINKLVDILYDNGTIEDYEQEEILGILGCKEDSTAPSGEPSPYSNDEIDDMFSDMCIS